MIITQVKEVTVDMLRKLSYTERSLLEENMERVNAYYVWLLDEDRFRAKLSEIQAVQAKLECIHAIGQCRINLNRIKRFKEYLASL